MGFRECDGRWRTPQEIDAGGAERVGLALAAMASERCGPTPRFVTGHDLRACSAPLHEALVRGMVRGGAHVMDAGLTLSPILYDAWMREGAHGCAMLTASHNPDGWTGVKAGIGTAPLTFGPEGMAVLREMSFGEPAFAPGGTHERIEPARAWARDIAKSGPLPKPVRVVVACGNGTAALFAPDLLARIGAIVIPLACEPDWTFPNHHPNPDAAPMQAAMTEAVRATGAEIAVGFDGDGDRIGAVDGAGRPIPADRLCLLLARDMAARRPGSRFVVDIKSTGLWATDPVLHEHGVEVTFGPTGHSHMKCAIAGFAPAPAAAFERSGHVFLAPPFGPGYDDGPRAAAALLHLVARRGPLETLVDALPRTWATPALEPYCPDAVKPAVAARLRAALRACGTLGGTPVANVVEAGGTRLNLQGGSWGLIRASQNTPNLVVMAESVGSPTHRDAILADLAALLRGEPEVGVLT